MRQPIYVLLALCVLFGCNHRQALDHTPAVAPAAEANPWTSLNFNNDPNNFQFAIVGDRTGRHRPGVFEKGIEKLNLLQPEFVMSVGDLIEGYTRDEAEIDQQWDEIEGFIAKLQPPFFYLPGNHDISNPTQAKKWRDRFGKAYYHFVYRDVLFLVINTSDPVQSISSAQIAHISDALKQNANVRWTCVFMHEPLWTYENPGGWDEVEKLLLDRKYTVFAGHHHTYTKYVRHDRRYLVLATMGGGMKSHLRGPAMGAFDHVVWVTMMPDGPRVANIELDAIHDEDIRTEAQAKVINRVLGGSVLQVSPVLVSTDTFERSPVTLTFRNEAEVALRAAGNIPAHGALRVTPDNFDVTVPPGSSVTVELALEASRPAKVSELSPLTVSWTAHYELPDDRPVRVPSESVLAVDRIHACPPRTSPVTIDGQLDEWRDLPLVFEPTEATTPAHWNGPADSSYRFGVAHDEDYLYIAVESTDDKPVLSALKEPWSQDGIEIRLDARPDPERSLGRGRGEFKEILVVSLAAPASAEEKMVHYGADQLPAGVKAICVKTATGYAAEVAVPVSYLNEKQGGAWSVFRMNVTVDDFDDPAGPLRALWWRPDWRSPDTFSGSGTFAR